MEQRTVDVSAGGMTDAVPIDRDWLSVTASAIGLVFSVGVLLLYSFGVFVRPLSAAFGWSRTGLSGAVATSQYALAFSAPAWGWLIDRYGPRAIMLPSVFMLSALLASLSLLTPHLWHLYVVFAAIPLVAGGATPLGYSAVLVRRFDRRLGRALGLALMGVGIGAAMLPPLAHALIDSFGWRGAYLVLGLLTLAISLPAAFVATRGAAAPVQSRTDAQSAAVAKAIRSSPFLIMCAAFILLGIVSIGVLAHLVPMMIDRGFTPGKAAQFAALTGLATVVARGGSGWLLDRYHARYLLAAMALLAAASFLLLAYVSGVVSSVMAAVLLGVVVGAEVDFISFLVRRYFDQALFGRVYGLAFGLYLLGVGTGPLVLAASFDHLGGYTPGLVGFAVVAALIVGLAMALPGYSNPASAGSQRRGMSRAPEGGPATDALRMQLDR